MKHLRSDNPINNKMHRERLLYNQNNIRVADRSRKHHRAAWYPERLAEVSQLSWNTTPCCCNLRVGYGEVHHV